MITANHAAALIESKLTPRRAVAIKTAEAIHQILAEDIHAPCDQPPFHRVSMDGVAIWGESLKQTNSFEIEAIAPAGHPIVTLKNPLNCVEVMTGAALPAGTNVVIPYEELQIEGKKATVLQAEKVKPFLNVHQKGSDYQKNTLVLEKNVQLTSSHISLIASCGFSEIKVLAKPKIAVISTGDELVDPGLVLQPHQIFKSNPFALKSQLEAFGFAINELIHLPDNKEKTYECLERVLKCNDIIVLSGGVSQGKFDFIPSVLADLGVEKVFHKVKQRPGKPLWFGVGTDEQLVFGLPGNPVSCLINLRKYVCEIIKPVQKNRPSFFVTLNSDIKIDKEMTFYVPAKITFSANSTIQANAIMGNGSGDFFQLRDSDGFIELDNTQLKNTFNKGEIYPFYHWDF